MSLSTAMDWHRQPKGEGKGKGKGQGKGYTQPGPRGDDRLAQLRTKAFERHGADTVWHFRNNQQERLVGGDYYVFSNLHDLQEPYYVTVHDPETGKSDSIRYPTSEQAYMAAKTLNMDIRWQISQMRTGGEAKRYCRSAEFKRHQRDDFWNISTLFMEDILRQKFADPQLRKILLDTGDAYIMEGNVWGDDFWGKVVKGGQLVGENHLGQILMRLREEIRREDATQARQREQEAQITLQAADFPSLGQPQVRSAQWPRAIAPPTPSLQVRGEEMISASAHDAEPTQLTTTRVSGHKGRRRWSKLA